MEKTSKKKMMITHQYPEKPEMIRIPWLKIFGTRSETTDLPVKKRNHRTDLRYSERTAWISIYTVCRKSTDGNESRAYLCMHEFEKTGKDPGKTRLEHSQIFVDFEENKKKRSFKRKMVLGIIPNTKFVYSLKLQSSYSVINKQ